MPTSDTPAVAHVRARPDSMAYALARTVAERPDALALDLGRSRFSWSELEAITRCTAAALTNHGLRRGERVLVQRGADATWLLAELSVQIAGGVPIHVAGGDVADCDAALVVSIGDGEAVEISADAPTVRLDAPDGPLWAAEVQRDIAALAADPGIAQAQGTGAAGEPGSVLLLHDATGSTEQVTHRNAALTYPGAVLHALGVVGPGDLVLVDGSAPKVLRTAWSAVVQAGAILAVAADAQDLLDRASRLEPAVVVPASAEAILESLISDHRVDGKPWSRSPQRSWEALVQASELQEQGKRVPAPLRRRAAATSALAAVFGPRLRHVVLGAEAPVSLHRMLERLDLPVLGWLVDARAGLVAISDPAETARGRLGAAPPLSELTVDRDDLLAVRGPGVGTPPTRAAGLSVAWHGLGLPAGVYAERLRWSEAVGVDEAASDASFLDKILASRSPDQAATADATPVDLFQSALTMLQAAAVPGTLEEPEVEDEQPGLPSRRRAASTPSTFVVDPAACVHRDPELEERIIRICPPVDAIMLGPSGGSGRVALVSMDPDRLAEWAAVAGLPGSTHADWATSQECRGFVGACLQSINSYLLLPDRVQQFPCSRTRWAPSTTQSPQGSPDATT